VDAPDRSDAAFVLPEHPAVLGTEVEQGEVAGAATD
jgi:hypothetical protein